MAGVESTDHAIERVKIGVMTEGDLHNVLEWAHQENWSPGDRDANPYLKADGDGFLIAKTESGRPVASISAVRFGENYGFIGFYITAPEFRGRGHGSAIFREAMGRLRGRTIGLDAVSAQQTNYAKHGFALAHQNVRFRGPMIVDTPTTSPPTTAPKQDDGVYDGFVVQALTQNDHVNLVVAYDNEHVPSPRPEFTRAWLTNSGHIARVALSTDNGGEIKGYGVLRPCSEGMRIGPLFAGSAEIADLLVRELVAASISADSSSAKATVFIDVPEPNIEGIRLAERLGLGRVCETGRMYRGPAPKLPLERVFGVTSLELG